MTDVISYKPSFAQHVGGQILARFRAKPPSLQPAYIVDEDGLRHYTIDLFLHSPNSEQIDLVEYIVDDPTFHDPLGYSDDASSGFHEAIRSYGDVPIDVKVYSGNRVYVQRAMLSELLKNGHAEQFTPAVADALERIKNN